MKPGLLNIAAASLGVLLVVVLAVDFDDTRKPSANAVQNSPVQANIVSNDEAASPGFEAAQPDSAVPTLLDEAGFGSGDSSLKPITADQVESFSLGIYSDSGYNDGQGRYIVDLLEQDYAYLALIVTDPNGRPVIGARPAFKVDGGTELLHPEEVASRSETDASGTIDFALIGGKMALDKVSITVGDATMQLLVNVISLEASGFPAPPQIDGGIPWSDLMSARIRYLEDSVSVNFPASVRQHAKKEIKLSGFMMPLDPDVLQRRFLLTSNPPSCFFHIPGGPAGAVEVFAPDGIEASWNPITVEGRFELLDTNEYGVIYRLQDAKLSEP